MSTHTTQRAVPNTPTILVLFGITGDLVQRKILAAMYHLFIDNLLPNQFFIVGVSHSDLDTQGLRGYLREILERDTQPQQDQYEPFLSRFTFVKADFTDPEAYQQIGKLLGQVDGEWKTCANKLFYLSVSPQFYGTIVDQLYQSNLTDTCSDEEGWTRVILEKPFGRNLASAKELDTMLSELFEEEQIYRVDHYLAKETVRNIIAFRFSNQILAPAWDNASVERISVRMHEKLDILDRGAFYDGVGALRDVGQNHLLQLVSVFTMENPVQFDAATIRKKRTEALQHIHTLTEPEVEAQTIRGQYVGYSETAGVEVDSDTETYFRITTTFDGGPFAGVPLQIEAGKALSDSLVEIELIFKHMMPCFCEPGKHEQNKLIYSIQPDEKMTIHFLVKKPGYDNDLSSQEFVFQYFSEQDLAQAIQPYEQLFLDIIIGDQTLFVSTEEVMQQWNIVEPILTAWQKGISKMVSYPKGTAPEAIQK